MNGPYQRCLWIGALVGLAGCLSATDDVGNDPFAEVEDLGGKEDWVGCPGSPWDESLDPHGEADITTLPLGSFDDLLGPGRILVLLSDKRFMFWDACGDTDPFLGCEELEIQGTYRFTRRTDCTRLVTLERPDGTTFERLRYELRGDELLVQPDSPSLPSLLPDRWTRFERTPERAYCREPDWCGLQHLTGDGPWTCEHTLCEPTPAELVVECLNGSRSFSVLRRGDALTGEYRTFDGTIETSECLPWDLGTIHYRCYGDVATTDPWFHQINVLRFASGEPGIEFNLVSARNEPGGGDILFSFTCQDGSTLDF